MTDDLKCSDDDCGWTGDRDSAYIPARDAGIDVLESDIPHCPDCYRVAENEQ